jgi:4'-phosphopantetheinyl transferase
MLKAYIYKISKKMNVVKVPPLLVKEISDYRHSQAKKQKIASHLLLTHLLRMHNIDVKNIAFNKYGKPFLKHIKHLHFNLSHTGEYVVCAISDTPVGVDIELTNSHIKKISSGFLTKKECQKYQTASNQRLTKLWTIKEAMVKLMGKGLSQRMNTIVLASQRLMNRRVYTYAKKYVNYPEMHLAIASYYPLPKIIKLKKLEL